MLDFAVSVVAESYRERSRLFLAVSVVVLRLAIIQRLAIILRLAINNTHGN